MKRFLILLLIVVTSSTYAQRKYYNQAVNSCTEKTSEELISKCIIDSYLLEYDFTTIDNELVNTKKIKKPIVLIAAATWSAPCWGDVPTLNKMVEKYHDKLEFIIIFWDNAQKVKKMAEKLDKRILLVPSREMDKTETGNLDISGFVHKLDYPTTYLIGKDKKFLNVKRGAATPTKEMNWDAVNALNTKNFEEFLAPVLN